MDDSTITRIEYWLERRDLLDGKVTRSGPFDEDSARRQARESGSTARAIRLDITETALD